MGKYFAETDALDSLTRILMADMPTDIERISVDISYK